MNQGQPKSKSKSAKARLHELKAERCRVLAQMERLEVAAETRRILRFEALATAIGSLVIIAPILIFKTFPNYVANPFGKPVTAAVSWGPSVTLTVLALAFVVQLLLIVRRHGPLRSTWTFQSIIASGALFIASASVVMIVTGTADLLRELTIPERLAFFIDSGSNGSSDTSPVVLHWLICAVVGAIAVSGLLVMFSNVVAKPSRWHKLNQVAEGIAEPSSRAAKTDSVPGAYSPQPAIGGVDSKTDVWWSRVMTLSVLMYLNIIVSAFLYFKFGHTRYMRDSVAVSFGMSAYGLNLILVFEGFRTWLVDLKSMRRQIVDSRTATAKRSRIRKWALANAAAALVYISLLNHRGLDALAWFIQQQLLPGWTWLQTALLTNVVAVVVLSIINSIIANRLDRALTRWQRRRRKASV